MSPGSLTALQTRMLRALAPVRPPWRLSGGGALAGFHAAHRVTRDLDLFWPPTERFDGVVMQVEACLTRDGLAVSRLQTAPLFVRLSVSDGEDRCVLGLIVDPTPIIDPPQARSVDGVEVLVDTAPEILANKLCALLSRSEYRDLVDVRWLLEHGGDLAHAVDAAARKDGGFSVSTLAWVLQGSDLDAIGRAAGVAPDAGADLRRWREGLIARLVASSLPA